MGRVKYKIQWSLLLIVVGGFGAMLLIVNLVSPNHPQALEGNLILSVALLFFGLNYTYGTYGLLDKSSGVLSRTDYFLFTKRLAVKDVKMIYFRQTWVVGGIARSLYILDNKEKAIEFPNVAWHEAVLAKIVRDIQSINPSTQLDEHTEALLRKYPQF